ncbi:MAG: DMT family transporter, partial [Alphaproteobacteria bacterium]|nr:DMT family transporter [Alphaproteobacteria bacterium]
MKVKSQPSIPRPWWERHALPLLVLGTTLLAMSPIFVRLSEVGPIATAVNRMMLPLPVFFAWLWLRPDLRIPVSTPTERRDLWLVALAGAFFAADLMVWHWSILLTSVANSTVLANLSPVWVVIAAWALFRERFTPLFVAGLALAMAGVIVLMGESLVVSTANFAGDALGFITAWFYAGYILTVSRVRQRVSTAATMAWGGLAATIILYAFALPWEGNVWPDTARGWAVAYGLAGITQVLGQMLIASSLAYVPAGFGSMVLL